MQAVKKRLKSFTYAWKGVILLFRSQPNAQIHLAIMLTVIVAGFFFHLQSAEWIYLLLTFSTVLAAEGFNTALEHLTDLASPDYHELAGKAKDVAAGAVLITAIFAALTGLIIFVPKFWNLLQ